MDGHPFEKLKKGWAPYDPEKPYPNALLDEPLPIEEYRERILTHIRSYRITFVQGETGCGKSSMVPQFLFHDDPENRILVTQPRRISAISLAGHVAKQLGPKGVQHVGYRLEHGEGRESPKTRITYCSTKYLLTFLSQNPDALKSFTHLVLDEVHERTTESDLLLLLTRILMRLHPHLRVVVMSATLQPQLFADYFVQFHPGLQPLQVGRQRFPVRIVFYEDLETEYPKISSFPAYNEAAVQSYENPTLTKSMQEVLVRLVMEVAKPGLCILVFLPGATEIENVEEGLRRQRTSTPLQVMPLHSLIPNLEQLSVLDPAEPDRCKVVLSTSLAESSITIPNTHFVIDCGLKKGVYADEETGRPSLLYKWISRASAQQRAGRTGRISPGTVVRLYTSQMHRIHFMEHDEAEISHALLERTLLTAKLLLSNYGTMSQIMKMVISPPNNLRIAQALEELARYGALSAPSEDAKVTTIGKLASQLPLDLPLIRLLLFGHVFGCLTETVVLATVLSQPDLYIIPSRAFASSPRTFAQQMCDNFADRVLFDHGTYSEALGGMNVYAAWLDQQRSNISYPRAKAADLMLVDLCRTLLLSDVLPLSTETRRDLTALLALGRGKRAFATATELVTQRPVQLLHFVLATAAAPNFLVALEPASQPMVELAAEHGLDINQTVHIKGLGKELSHADRLQKMVRYPDVKVSKVVITPSTVQGHSLANDALLELAPFSPRGYVQPTGDILDVGYAPRLLQYLFIHGRGKLPILEPRAMNEEELVCGGLVLSNQVGWAVLGMHGVGPAFMNAKINMRSPLANLSDMDFGSKRWNPYIASAFTLLPTNVPSEVLANGVTLAPTKYFGNFMVLLNSRRVLRVFLRLAPDADDVPPKPPPRYRKLDKGASVPEPEYSKSKLLVISAAVVEHKEMAVRLSFEPYFFDAKQWGLMNIMRALITRAVQGSLVEEGALQKDAYLLLEAMHLPDFRIPLRGKRHGLTPSYWQASSFTPSSPHPTPETDGTYWDPPKGERHGGLTWEERAPPEIWQHGWVVDVMDYDEDISEVTWSEHFVEAVNDASYLPEIKVGKEFIEEELRLRRMEENQAKKTKKQDIHMEAFRNYLRKALTEYATIWAPSGALPLDYPKERMPEKKLCMVHGLASVKGRERRRRMGYEYLRDLLECEALSDTVVIRPTVGDPQGFLLERAPTFCPVKVRPPCPIPVVPPPVPRQIRPTPKRLEYMMLRDIFKGLMKEYRNGVLFSEIMKTNPMTNEIVQRRRRAIGFSCTLDAVLSMPDIVRVEGCRRTGYKLYPADTPPTPEADLLYLEGDEKTGWLLWELEQEGYNCGMYPRPGEAELAAQVDPSWEPKTSNAFAASEHTTDNQENIEMDQPDDVARQIEDGMTSPEVLAKLASEMWTLDECRTYACLRAAVLSAIELYPNGVNGMSFVLNSDLSNRVSREKREALGFRSMWEILQSMSDIVKMVADGSNPGQWMVYPANYVPTEGSPSSASDDISTTMPPNVFYQDWTATDGNITQVPVFLAADQCIADFPVPRFAVCKRKAGVPGSGYIRREFFWFRDLVKRAAQEMPGPMSVEEFADFAGLKSKKAVRQRHGLRSGKLLTFVASMPDIVTLQADPDTETGFTVSPAPKGVQLRRAWNVWEFTSPWPGEAVDQEFAQELEAARWGTPWEGDEEAIGSVDEAVEAEGTVTADLVRQEVKTVARERYEDVSEQADHDDETSWGKDWDGEGLNEGWEQRETAVAERWLSEWQSEEALREEMLRQRALLPIPEKEYIFLPPPDEAVFVVVPIAPPTATSVSFHERPCSCSTAAELVHLTAPEHSTAASTFSIVDKSTSSMHRDGTSLQAIRHCQCACHHHVALPSLPKRPIRTSASNVACIIS